PAALMVTALAWAYVEYGDTPAVESLLYGVVPAVLAVIAFALVALLRTLRWSCKDARQRLGLSPLTAAALAAYVLGVPELAILAAGAAVPALVRAASLGRGHALLGVP